MKAHTAKPILFTGPMVLAILNGTKTQTRRIMKNQPVSVEWWKHGEPSDSQNGVAVMRDENGSGWSSCGKFRCPYLHPNMCALPAVVNSNLEDKENHKSLLWVKETWKPHYDCMLGTCVRYRADGLNVKPTLWDHDQGGWCEMNEETTQWRPSIFMPRWASRLTLEIVKVRVERLQDISEEDVRAEGIKTSVGSGMIEGEVAYHFTTNSGYCRGLAGARLAYSDLWESINGPGSWAKNPWVWVIEFKKL